MLGSEADGGGGAGCLRRVLKCKTLEYDPYASKQLAKLDAAEAEVSKRSIARRRASIRWPYLPCNLTKKPRSLLKIKSPGRVLNTDFVYIKYFRSSRLSAPPRSTTP